MPTTDSKALQEAIRRTLEHHSGGTRDARSVAEATLRTWQLMADRLAPVIGTKGVDTLFSYSLYLTCATYRWLEIAENHGENADLPASILARLSSREADAAAEAGYTLLVTFTELLATMIGESLTERLLLPAWVLPSLESKPGTKQETKP